MLLAQCLSRLLFDALFSCSLHTHACLPPPLLPHPLPCRRLDPPANYFRIRLVCTLLEVCGQYFTRGVPRRKLDRFLPAFQRYLLAKPPLPLDVEFDVQVGWAGLG